MLLSYLTATVTTVLASIHCPCAAVARPAGAAAVLQHAMQPSANGGHDPAAFPGMMYSTVFNTLPGPWRANTPPHTGSERK
jgi:hypothetical protein